MAIEQGNPISILVLKGEKGDSGEGADNISFANITGNPEDNGPLSEKFSTKLEAEDLSNIPHKQDVKDLTNKNSIDIENLFRNLGLDIKSYIARLAFKMSHPLRTLYLTTDVEFNPNLDENFNFDGMLWELIDPEYYLKTTKFESGAIGGKDCVHVTLPPHVHSIREIKNGKVLKTYDLFSFKISRCALSSDPFVRVVTGLKETEYQDEPSFVIGDEINYPLLSIPIKPKFLNVNAWLRVK